MSGTEMVIQPTTFRDSSTIATFINIILGILLGGAIVWFLIVPANRQSVNDAANKQVTDANTKLATESVKVQELQDEIDSYVEAAERAEKERDDALAKAQSYEDLLAVANVYVSGDQTQAASLITSLNGDDFDGNAKTLYDTLNGVVQSSLFTQYYNAGTTAYVAKDYTTAAAQLKSAVDSDPQRTQSQHGDALLYLGMSYYYLGDTANADAAFNQIVEHFPNVAQQYGVAGYISSNGGTVDPAANAANLSGLGEGTTGQNAENGGNAGNGTGGTGAGGNSGGTGDGNITIQDNQGNVTGNTLPADSYPAWTDPNTGSVYDQYGNFMY